MFHEGYRPNLFIYEDTYKCASCGKWGKTEDLLNYLLGKPVSYSNEQTNLRNPFTRWTRDKTLLQVLRSAKRTLHHRPEFRSYLLKRGLDHPTIDKLKLGYKDDWYTFPIFNGGLVGAVARAGESRDQTFAKYIVPQGQDPNLLYIPSRKRLEAQRTIFLTFGILDSISLYMLGLASCSTLSGQKIDSASLDFIRKKLYIIPDRHEESSADKLASKLGWRGTVLRLDYPDGCDDPNDVFVKSPQLLKDMIDDKCK